VKLRLQIGYCKAGIMALVLRAEPGRKKGVKRMSMNGRIEWLYLGINGRESW
jgi:hypothetical protein